MSKPRSVAATANNNSIPGSRLENGTITANKLGVGVVSDGLYANVKDYGAVGDGVTPDGAAIQRVILFSYVKNDNNVAVTTISGGYTPGALTVPLTSTIGASSSGAIVSFLRITQL